jgi:hypothetical protein
VNGANTVAQGSQNEFRHAGEAAGHHQQFPAQARQSVEKLCKTCPQMAVFDHKGFHFWPSLTGNSGKNLAEPVVQAGTQGKNLGQDTRRDRRGEFPQQVAENFLDQDGAVKITKDQALSHWPFPIWPGRNAGAPGARRRE